MSIFASYFASLAHMLSVVEKTQSNAIETASDWLATSLGNGGVAHLFGSGHSHMVAEEAFHRAGSLLPMNPMLDANLTFLGHLNATTLERTTGYGTVIVASHDIRAGEVVFVVSNSGVNPVPIEVAIAAQARGARTVAITSLSAYEDIPARTSDGRRLGEVTDITIDTCVPRGDALIASNGGSVAAGGASSAIGIAIINAIVVETATIMRSRGIEPPLIPSMNVPGGDEKMAELVARYGDRLPLLRHA